MPKTTSPKPVNPYNVQIGQIWQDNDPRQQEGQWGLRFIKVFTINTETGKAECYNCNRDGILTQADDKRYRNGKPRIISLQRFKPNSSGYILISPS